MKVQIRRGVFETNSSSNHSLIITNRKNFKKECEKVQKKCEWYVINFSEVDDQVCTKEDKVLMLGGLFDYEVQNFGILQEEYEIFLKILKDNNEIELLEKVKENSKEYEKHSSEPYCTNYFYEGCLSDCTCSFYSKFLKYFDYESLKKEYYMYDDIRVFEIEDINEKEEMIQKIIEENKEIFYKKLYDFIYGDGVIVPYGEL